jgi:DMSO/TMAO reductase YedYZ molybdopterin-dependent catalytic subunit
VGDESNSGDHVSSAGPNGGPELPPERSLPPGQHLLATMPVMHYGPVPRPRPDRWRFTVGGATQDGVERAFPFAALLDLPTVDILADLHCATRWSVLDRRWRGVAARDVLALAAPAPDVAHVLVFAEYGYSVTVELEDLASSRSILATHLDGEALSPERGGPMRLVIPHLYSWKGPKWVRGWNYLTTPERGFWEQRGYHLRGDAWREERYGYQE